MLMCRSVSDPGPPLLVPSYHSKTDPEDLAASGPATKVIEQFQKMVTQDPALELVREQAEEASGGQLRCQTSVIVQQSDSFLRTQSVPNGPDHGIPPGPHHGLSNGPYHGHSHGPHGPAHSIHGPNGRSHGPNGPSHGPNGPSHTPLVSTDPSVIAHTGHLPSCRSRYILNGTFYPSQLQDNMAAQANGILAPKEEMQDDRTDSVRAKIQPASSANEVLKYLMREERNGLFDNNIGEDVRAFKELLAEKDSIDFNSFMNEMSEEGPPVLNSRKRCFLNPPSPSLTEDSLLPKYLEEDLIKLEPCSNPSSPMETQYIVEQHLQQVPALEEAKARAIYLRTQSQDSMTRTKNPVLPSIHAESGLVPDPKVVKYPVTTQESFSLDFEEEREGGGLTDLRGQLFLSEEYGQNIFQPWN